MKNAKKYVYNGIEFDENKPNTLLKETIRLLSKSANSHYYYISAHPSDNKHYLWESYSKKNLLHTNLSLNYEFRDIFLRKEWDTYLVVSEVGNELNILKNKKYQEKENNNSLFDELKSGKRKIILICSYEAVRQLHAGVTNENLVEKHKEWIVGNDTNFDESIIILLMPFWQHNHHVNIFLKSTTDLHPSYEKRIWQPRIKNKIGFSLVGSFYIYRKGLSNSIDPLFIGLTNNLHALKDIYHLRDYGKLLAFFFTYACRALLFEKSLEIDISKRKYSDFALDSISEPEKYDKWETQEFYNNMDKYLIALYNSLISKS